MALPPGFVEENASAASLPPGYEEEKGAQPPKRAIPAPPPPPGLISSFFGGVPGASGGLADIPRGLASMASQAASGLSQLPGALSNFAGEVGDPPPSITGLPPALEALVPGGALALGAGKSLLDSSKEQFKQSREKGRGILASAAASIPFIGEPAALAGESLASGDPSKMAAGAGSTAALLLPFGAGRALAKGAAKLPVLGKIAPAVEEMAATGVTKSYARALEPPTKKLALAAREVAPTLADANISGMTRDQLARHVAAKTSQAGKAVDATIQFHSQAPIDKPAVLARLKSAANPHLNPLTGEPFTPEGANAVATVGEIVDAADKNLGPNPTVKDLAAYKRALDKMVTKGNSEKMYGDLARSGRLSYYKDAANVLRDVLNDVHPDIAGANKNFSQWATAKKVVQEAQKSRTAKEITQPGTLGGLGTHTTLPGVVAKAWQALSLKHSPAWNTFMGAQKQAVNLALKTGDFSPIEDLLATSLLKPPSQKPTYFPGLKEALPPPPPDLGAFSNENP